MPLKPMQDSVLKSIRSMLNTDLGIPLDQFRLVVQ